MHKVFGTFYRKRQELQSPSSEQFTDETRINGKSMVAMEPVENDCSDGDIFQRQQRTNETEEDYHRAVKKFVILCNKFIEWEKKYHHIVNQRYRIDANFRSYSTAAQQLQAKEEKRKMDVVLVGTTSSGKSLMMNALIRMDAMRSGVGHTTPCATLIEVTDEDTPFFVTKKCPCRINVDFSTKEGRDKFQDVVDNVSGQQSDECVKLFLPKGQVQETILTSNVALLDSPGIERDVFRTEDAQQKVEAADALVLLIDIITGLNEENTLRLLDNSNFFVKPNLLVVVNKCDKLKKESEHRQHKLIEFALSEIIAFLTRENGPYRTVEEARDVIYFLSAKEVRENQSKDEEQRSSVKGRGYIETPHRFYTTKESRSDGFRHFESCLVPLSEDQRENKKGERIMKAVDGYKKALRSEATQVGNKINEVRQKLGSTLAKSGFEDEKRYDEFVVNFYYNHFKEGELNVAGKEKANKFLSHLINKGFAEIRAAILPRDWKIDDRLVGYFDQILKLRIEAVCREVEEDVLKKFASTLDPVEDFSIFDKQIEAIESQMANLKVERVERKKERAQQLNKKLQVLQKTHDDVSRERSKKLDDLKAKRSIRGEFVSYAVAGIAGLGGAAGVGGALVFSAPIMALIGVGFTAVTGIATTAGIKNSINRGKLEEQIAYEGNKKKEDDLEAERKLENTKTEKRRRSQSVENTDDTKTKLALAELDAEIQKLKLKTTKERTEQLRKRPRQHQTALAKIMSKVVCRTSSALKAQFEKDSEELQTILDALMTLMK